MSKPIILRFVGDTTGLSAAFARASGMADGFGSRLSKLSAGFSNVGKSMQSAGRKMTTSMTLPIVGAGVAAVKLATDFQTSMGRIQGLVGASSQQVETWSKQLIDLGPKVGKSPQELADALYFVTSSGIDASKAMDVVTVSAKAAAAGLGDTQTIADAVTSAMNAYGADSLSAAQATDILTNAVKLGKGEPDELAGALGRVIAPAQSMGISFDQVGAAMAAMTDVGLDANESATALRSIIMSMANPTAEQTKALKDMGLSLADVRDVVKKKGLLAALQMLHDKSGGNVEALSSLIGNVRGLNGFMIMTGKNAGTTAEIFDEMTRSTGATDKAFAVASKTAKFKFDAALSRLQGTAIKFGNIMLPIITKVADKLGTWFEKLGKLNPQLQKWVIIGALVVAAIGPLVFIIGSIATAIGFLLSPVGLVILAIAALAVGFVVAYKKVKPFHDAVDRLVKKVRADLPQMKKTVLDVWEKVKRGFDEAVQVFDRNREKILSIVRQVVSIFQMLATLIRPILDLVVAIVKRAVGVIQNVWDRFGHTILDKIRIAWNAIVQIIRGALEALRGVIEIVTGIITLRWGKVWQGIKDLFGGVWNVILGIVKLALNAVSTQIAATMAYISLVWSYVWNAVKGVLSGIWNAITTIVMKGVGAVKGALGSIWSFIVGLWDTVYNAGKTLGSKIVGGLKDGIMAVGGFASDVGGAILNAVKGAWNWFADKANGIIPDKIGRWPLEIDLPDNPIPTFAANGGIFTKPTLTVLGEAGAEAVIPLTRPSRAAQLLGESGLLPPAASGARGMTRTRQGGGLNIENMTIVANDPREAARVTADEWTWLAKTGGF